MYKPSFEGGFLLVSLIIYAILRKLYHGYNLQSSIKKFSQIPINDFVNAHSESTMPNLTSTSQFLIGKVDWGLIGGYSLQQPVCFNSHWVRFGAGWRVELLGYFETPASALHFPIPTG
jgi:hypothetical protein